MKNKNNIFHYATKELTQDAFLRWLLENFDSDQEDVKHVSREIIKAFLDDQNVEIDDITQIETFAQVRKLDILAIVTTKKSKHVIAIEDKTETFEHNNQLYNYRQYLQKTYAEYKQHYVFYKTSPMTSEETSLVSSKGWTVFDIVKIYGMFINLEIDIKHYLISSYIQYIESLFKLYTGVLPVDITEWEIKQWQNYALQQSISLPPNIDCMIGNYRNQYYMFAYNFKNHWNKGPYIEFRSRDVKYQNFSMRILIYGIDESIVAKNIDKWKDQIRQSNLYKVQNHKKQIGTSIIKEKINNVGDLEKIILKYIDEFSRIMSI